jgi:AraC-like DNA-binding protein
VTFAFEARASDSPFVDRVWRARSERPGAFFSVASLHWEMVVTRRQGTAFVTVRGPQTWATKLDYPADIEWFGITFQFGTLMPQFPPRQLLNGRDVNFPEVAPGSFWLRDSAWECPTFDTADEFVLRLQRAGLLARDPVVQAVYRDDLRGRSVRSIQDHFARTTGLTQTMVRQIERAHAAADLLALGVPAVDAAHEQAYYDQPHLTRSLKRFLGRTPAQIARDRSVDGVTALASSPGR